MPTYGFSSLELIKKVITFFGGNMRDVARVDAALDKFGSDLPQSFRVMFQNKSGETIPPFAAFAIDDVVAELDRFTVKAVKPTNVKFRPIAFNGPHEVANNELAPVIHCSGIVRARYASGATVTANRVLGITDWELSHTGRRFASIRSCGAYEPSTRTALVDVSQLGDEFPIKMQVDGGVDGTALLPPTWTYTISDEYTSAQIATAINPTAAPHGHIRFAAGKTTNTSPVWSGAATLGRARYDHNGALVVLWCNELIYVRSC